MLDVHSVISKSCLGLFLCSTECHVKSGFIFRHTHSFSASAESRLYDHRIADLSCNFFSFCCIINRFPASRNDWNPGIFHGISRLGFISKPADHFRIRSNKNDVALLTKLCKFRIFRKETKSRMDRICSRHDGRADDLLHIQIAFRRWCRSNTDCFICKLCMQCFFICF